MARLAVRCFSIAVLVPGLIIATHSDTAECPTSGGSVVGASREPPYFVTVAVQPDVPHVGPVRMLVAVCDGRDLMPVDGADVTIVPINPGGLTGRPALALSRGVPGEYSADLNIKQGGEWRYRVRVRSRLGEAEQLVGVYIFQPEGGDAGAGWLFVGVAGALVLGGGYLVREARRSARGTPERR